MTVPSALPGGVFAASLTPLTDTLAIDHTRLVAHLRHLLAEGCDGVVLFGTTGEATSFSREERQRGLDAVLEAGLPPHRLLVGTGCCAVPDTVALTRHAGAAGVGGVLVLPPFYYKNISEEGLFAAFDQLVQQTDGFPVYLYHIPQMSAVPIPAAVVARLRERYPEVVVGMKDSGGDFGHMAATREAFPALRLFAGTEALLLDVLRAGGAGCISATVNVTHRQAAEVFARWQAGDEQGARVAQDALTARRRALEAFPVIAALKHLLAGATGHAGWRRVRPPLVPLNAAEVASLDALAR